MVFARQICSRTGAFVNRDPTVYCNCDILQGWIQSWYSDCQEQLGALNKQIYTVLQQEESECQEADSDKPAKISVTASDIRNLLESKEQLLAQAEGKL
jgi:hypothetical protein